ncbi:unnamed protein product [marine sediment metagenome]|uniref:Uncharacterized protein n=1 Tax=marine sediment metagenome TaxID=412755 RepID=X1I3M6_9ZZZZ
MRWVLAPISLTFLFGKQTAKQQNIGPELLNIDTWFSEAQEKIASLDERLKNDREAGWAELSEEQRLRISEQFVEQTFGAKSISKYTLEEKLKLGGPII